MRDLLRLEAAEERLDAERLRDLRWDLEPDFPRDFEAGRRDFEAGRFDFDADRDLALLPFFELDATMFSRFSK